MPGAPDPLYVTARDVLLDALEALGPHRSSLVLVGAQAIYLHTGEAGIAVAPFTTDADMVIDPEGLAELGFDPPNPVVSSGAGATVAILRLPLGAADRWPRRPGIPNKRPLWSPPPRST